VTNDNIRPARIAPVEKPQQLEGSLARLSQLDVFNKPNPLISLALGCQGLHYKPAVMYSALRFPGSSAVAVPVVPV